MVLYVHAHLNPNPPLHTMEQVDQALIKSAQKGDESAFEALVHKHHQGVKGFIKRKFNIDEFMLEEMTQIVFIKAWREIARFNFTSTFKTWLCAIASNTTFNALRSERKRREGYARYAIEQRLSRATRDNPRGWDNVKHVVMSAIKRLSPEDAQIICLVLSGLSGKQIAKIIDRKETVIPVLFKRAVANLRGDPKIAQLM